MVSDQEIAKGVETLLRQSDPNVATSLNGVVQQLEQKLGLDLSHKAGFIRDQINLLLRSHPIIPPSPPLPRHQLPPPPPPPQQPQHQQLPLQQQIHFAPKDHFALHPQFQQFPSPHFALHHPHQHHVFPQDLNFRQPHAAPNPPPPLQQQHVQPPPQVVKPEVFPQNAPPVTTKESTPVGAKRRGGPGGLNKVCGVSPELQAIVGQPALPRTEIVKQLWAYIRKNNLQDPSNKRKIICDDALRVVFETDCTDMFKMNKLLAKHITTLEPTKESGQAKRVKVDVESTTESAEQPALSSYVISEALAKFLGIEVREMTVLEACNQVREYIVANHLEDPVNKMVINCDAKLRDLLGCESISAFGVDEMLKLHHLFKHT